MTQSPAIQSAIQEGRVVFLVDHLDDVEALGRLGFMATKSAANLDGANVVILPRSPDDETLGLTAEQLQRVAKSLRVVHLPALIPSGGLTEWFANGGSAQRLRAVVQSTPRYGFERRSAPRGPLRPELAYQQARDRARARANLIRSGIGLSFPWPKVHQLVGNLVPGQLVVLGGRAKQGKSTFLRECFEFWIEFGKKIMLVGTEQSVEEVRALWACQQLGLPPEAINLPEHQDAILADIEGRQYELRDRALIYVPDRMDLETLADLTHLAATEKCDAVIFDHFSRMDLPGRRSKWEESADGIKQVKKMARNEKVLLVAGAQLTDGEGAFGQFDVPTGASWAYTKELQRECDVGAVIWRPLRRPPSNQELVAAKTDPEMAEQLIEPDCMAFRLVAHRLRTGAAMDRGCRLRVQAGRISSWGWEQGSLDNGEQA